MGLPRRHGGKEVVVKLKSFVLMRMYCPEIQIETWIWSWKNSSKMVFKYSSMTFTCGVYYTQHPAIYGSSLGSGHAGRLWHVHLSAGIPYEPIKRTKCSLWGERVA